MAIPKEYLDSEFDFGFSTADDETVVTTPAPVVNTQDISEPIIEKLQALEALVVNMAETVSRLENASTPLDTDEYKALIEKDVDLTARLQTDYDNEISDLAIKFNLFLEQLHNMFKQVSDSANHVKSIDTTV